MAVDTNPGTEMGMITRNRIPKAVAAIQAGSILQLDRDSLEEGSHHPNGIRQGKTHIGDDQHNRLVDQLQAGSNDEERQDQGYFRDHAGGQDTYLDGVVKLEWNSHQRVGCQAADDDANDRHE